MTQRSPFNDRYKVDQKGKTRKSASAAKPKRAVSDVGVQAKKKSGRGSAWSRAKSASASKQRSTTRAPEPKLVPTERFRRLTRLMWSSWAVSLVGAIAVLWMQSQGGDWLRYLGIGWIVYFVGIGFAFYLQFVPIRQERAVMLEQARAGHGKKEKQGKGPKAPVIDAPGKDDAGEDTE